MNIALLITVVSLLVFIFLFVSINIKISVPSYRGPESDHFDGQEFQNLGNAHEGQFRDFLRWITNRKKGSWQKWVAIQQQIPPNLADDQIGITFVNHSTFLIRTKNITILTDPVWSDRVSPFSFIGPKRNKLPGVALENVPKVDVILISHNHYDHLDVKTLKFFYERDKSIVVCPLGNAKFLLSQGILSARDIDWWEKEQLLSNVCIDCVPAQHFSGRSMFDRNQTLWAGYVISISEFGNIYFAGDTGFGVHFNQIAEKFKTFEIGLLPIGAYKPEWFMSPVHISPKEAVVVHDQLNIKTTIAMHFGTFPLADDSEEDPKNDLQNDMKKKPRDIRIPQNGESFVFQK